VYGFLLALLILDGLLLSVIVLLQSGKGGGLAAMGGGAGGTDSLIGGRQAATLLTKATWIAGGTFLGLALVLSVLSTRQDRGADPILRGEFQQQAAPTPIVPGATPAEPGAQPLPGATPGAGAAPDAGGNAPPPEQ
jgi:preprotein translocase subunit SecG